MICPLADRIAKVGLFLLATGIILTAWLGGSARAGSLIYLEPGHGGNTGAYSSPGGYYEDQVNLAIGLRLRDLLQAHGYPVYMSRTDNTWPGGSNPAVEDIHMAQANAMGAAIFLSIHNDSSTAPTASGTSVFYANKSQADITFANLLHTNLIQAIRGYGYNTSDRGLIVPDSGWMIWDGKMPSVLIETLFVSNATEARILLDPFYQQAVAQGLYNAISATVMPSDPPSPPPTNPPSTTVGKTFPLIYDYGSANARIWTVGRCDEAVPTVWPVEAWVGGLGGFDAKRCQLAAGDFDGDTNGDTAVLYDYGGATAALWLFLNNQGNGKLTPVMVWKSAAGGFDATRVKMAAGNFNGTGSDDVAMLYDYGHATSRLWTFAGNSSAMTPTMAWYGPGFDAARAKMVAGNFNGGGADDVAILYDYGNATSRLWTFVSNGSTMAPAMAWYGPGFDAARAKIVAGNFNGAGADDVAMLYDYGGSKSRIWSFVSNGSTMTPGLAWYGPSFDASRAKIAAGDFGGDAKSDIAMLYEYGNAATRIWTAVSTGTSMNVTQGWYSGTYQFSAKQAKVEGERPASGNSLTVRRPLIVSPLGGQQIASPVTLKWSAITGATAYDVEILNAMPSVAEGESTGASAQRIAIESSATTSLAYNIGGLVGGRAYYYRVIARTGTGFVTGYSAADSFTTPGVPAANRGYPLLYDYGAGNSKLWAMMGSGGTMPKIVPSLAWASGIGGFDAKRCQFAAGDFDGDGTGDTAVLYDYGGATTGIWLFLNNQGNGNLTPVLSWRSTNGTFDASRAKIAAGNFDGDAGNGAEVALLYDYGGATSRIWTFSWNRSIASPASAVNMAWFSGTGVFDAARSSVTGGDYTGDGRGDIAILYDDGASTSRIWSMVGNGTMFSPTVAWSSGTGVWDAARTRIVSGDFGGDGKADVAMLYDYGSSTAGIWSMVSNGTTFVPVAAWNSGAGNFDISKAKMTSGNFGGDAKSDVALMYDYGGATSRIWAAVTSGATMTLNLAWYSGAGAFDARQAKIEGERSPIITNTVTISSSGAYQVRNSAGSVLMSLAGGDTASVGYSGGQSLISASGGQSAVVAGYVRFTPSAGAILRVNNMAEYSQFRGALEVRYSSVSNQLWVINELDMQSYMKGMGEEPESSAIVPDARYPEFLKLSAVAFRSYAYDIVAKKNKHPGEPFDVVNTPADQWYIGYERELQGPKLAAAVDATNGQVVSYLGAVARTPYFSDCGGATDSAASQGWNYPWCAGVTDSVCAGHTPSNSHHVGICMDGARRRVAAGADYNAVLHFYLNIDAAFLGVGNPTVRVGVYSVTP